MMNRKDLSLLGMCLAVALLVAASAAAQVQPSPSVEQRIEDQADGEILTSGPMHEAFAKAVPLDPEPGITVPKRPPDPIEEIPPDQRPAEDQAVWIPGYWGWDENRGDFVWISGVWRVPPPGADWVPGYWAQVAGGYQWISGYWVSRDVRGPEGQRAADEVVYLPGPPQTLEAGPSSPPPSEGLFWIPGCWVWRDVRYVWRPGYWAVGMPGWVWIPAHYVWAPAGCVFVPGHWDYVLERRGLLFAPVYFGQVVYTRPAFHYVPTVVINTTILHTSLFVWPRYCHYYFGDYYAPAYRDIGIVAWFSFHGGYHGYDPLFAYHCWRHGHDHRWLRELHDTYEHRARHEDARPPRTYRAMQELVDRQPPEKRVRMAARLSELDEIRELPVHLKRIDEQQHQKYVRSKEDFRQFTKARADLERQLGERGSEARPGAGPAEASAGRDTPRRLRLPENPLAWQDRDHQHGQPDATRVDRHQPDQQRGRLGFEHAEAGPKLGNPGPEPRVAQPDRREASGFRNRLGSDPPETSQRREAAGSEGLGRQAQSSGRADRPAAQPGVSNVPEAPSGQRFDRSSRWPLLPNASGTTRTADPPGLRSERSTPDLPVAPSPVPGTPDNFSDRRWNRSDAGSDFRSGIQPAPGPRIPSESFRQPTQPGLDRSLEVNRSDRSSRQFIPAPPAASPGGIERPSARIRGSEAGSPPNRGNNGRSSDYGGREGSGGSERSRGRGRD